MRGSDTEDVKVDVKTEPSSAATAAARCPAPADASGPGGEAHGGAEPDRVVREIDVFLNPSLGGDAQTAMTAARRPPPSPPLQVRTKARQARLELDLAVDVAGESFDASAPEHLRITKQTLTSSRQNMAASSYAVGVLCGDQLVVAVTMVACANCHRSSCHTDTCRRQRGGRRLALAQLHLNPLRAVVQLRPSFAYLDDADTARRAAANCSKSAGVPTAATAEDAAAAEAAADEIMVEADGLEAKNELVPLQVHIRRRETERQEESRLQSHAYLKQQDEAEPWIELKTFSAGCPEARAMLGRMMTAGSDHDSGATNIPFTQSRSQYLDTLVPGRTVAAHGLLAPAAPEGPPHGSLSRSYLETLPLERRLIMLLSKGQMQVLQFERLMKLAPAGAAEADVLRVLRRAAVLVQGCWVASSELRYTHADARAARDFVLLLFVHSRVIEREQLDELKVPKELLREILAAVSVQRGSAAGWEFLESTDRAFLKRHQDVAREQAARWERAEGGLRARVAALRAATEAVDMVELMATPEVADVSLAEEEEEEEEEGRQGRSVDASAAAAGASGRWARARLPGRRANAGSEVAPMDVDVPLRSGKPSAAASRGKSGARAGRGRSDGEVNGADGARGPGRGSELTELNRELAVVGELPPAATAHFASAGTMSDTTRAALPGALRQIFEKHNVCTLQFVSQSLRELAITSAAKPATKASAIAATALEATSVPPVELAAEVAKLAIQIDGAYFLSSLNNVTLDPFREVVIALLKTRVSGMGLRKTDIMEAAKLALKTDVPNTVYQKVLKELCYTRGGVWVLKPGDGRPSN
eukprot:SM000063S20041  [mRNA]  locus=s63:444754:450477:- [translate_table: standard]